MNTNDKVISYRRDSENLNQEKSKSRQIADSLMPISSNWGYTVSNIYLKKNLAVRNIMFHFCAKKWT